MKKIVFVVADITMHGGVERVITALASTLATKGYPVEILSIHRCREELFYVVHPSVTVNFVDKNMTSGGKPKSMVVLLYHLKSAFRLNFLLKNQKDCFIVANSFPVAALMYPSLFFSQNKYAVVEHVYHGYYRALIQKVRKFIYKKFIHVVALTDIDADFYRQNGLKSVTIPNALSFKAKKQNIADVEKRKLLAVGRLEYQKGFDLLIRAFSQLDNELQRTWQLDIYGTGTQKDTLQQQIDEANLTQNIYLKGMSDNLESQYAEYDFFVMSSRFEGFGMVILEAMSCGLPIISFNCPTGPSDLLGDGEYGLLIDEISTEKLSLALKELMRNTELRQKLSEKSLSRSRDFQIDKIVKNWEKLFNIIN